MLRNVGRFHYISMIKKHPRGIERRLPQFDAWVGSWKDPHIRDYYQFYYNCETREHDPCIPDDVKAKAELEAVYSRHRPHLQKVFAPTQPNQEFVDDHMPTREDTGRMRLGAFLKECLKKETRGELHVLVLWGAAATVSFVLMMLRSVVWADYAQPNIHLDPHETYYHYNIHILRDEVDSFVGRINMLSSHSEEVMREAKRKALLRLEHSQ